MKRKRKRGEYRLSDEGLFRIGLLVGVGINLLVVVVSMLAMLHPGIICAALLNLCFGNFVVYGYFYPYDRLYSEDLTTIKGILLVVAYVPMYVIGNYVVWYNAFMDTFFEKVR